MNYIHVDSYELDTEPPIKFWRVKGTKFNIDATWGILRSVNHAKLALKGILATVSITLYLI